MKVRFCSAMFALLLFSGVCLAQVPAPVILSSASDEVSADFLWTAKGATPWSFGWGGQTAGAHFFTQHFGVKGEADYERMSYFSQTDIGFRGGPVIRFGSYHRLQPFVEALVGYAQVRAAYLEPPNTFHGSGSILGGGGVDFPLPARGWYARAGVEVQDDWDAHSKECSSCATRVGRGFFGVAYEFHRATQVQ